MRYEQTRQDKKAIQKYEDSEKGKQTRKNYEQSELGKKAKRKYMQSEKGKKVATKYIQSEKGKRAVRITHAHNRGMGYNELCKNPYSKDIKIVYHHINNIDVISIPVSIHAKFSGNNITHKQHQKFIATWIKENYPTKIRREFLHALSHLTKVTK